MASLRFQHTTSVTVEEFISALTNFGPERARIWSNSQPEYLELHEQGDNWAVLTEGSNFLGGAWERVRYDWSQPDKIIIETLDSNIWTKGSGWSYHFRETPDGAGLIIDCHVERFPINGKARIIMLFAGTLGRPLIIKSFHNTIKHIEDQSK